MNAFILLSFILFSWSASAQTPPSLELVERYVTLAQAVDETTLRGINSEWQCHFPIIYRDINASGQTREEATQRLQLLCIKKECQTIGKKVNKAAAQIMQMKAQQLRDFLEFAQYTPEEINTVLKERGLFQSPSTELTCETAPSNYKMVVFDSCFSTPVTCEQR